MRVLSGPHCNSYLSVLEEEEITFAPTYRFERGTREKYAYTKQKATGVGENSCLFRSMWQSREITPTEGSDLNQSLHFVPLYCFERSQYKEKDLTQIYGA